MGKKELTPITAKSAQSNSNPEFRRTDTIILMAAMLREKFPELDLFEATKYAYDILELVEKELYDGSE